MKAVCAKIKDREFYPELDEIGVWYGDAERRIWQSVYVEGQSVKAVKKAEVISNMTGRQFNSIRIDLDASRQGRGANPQSEQTPPVIRPVEPPTCDAARLDARPNLVSVGARVPTPGGPAVQPPRSTRRKAGHRVSSEVVK
jgi:hypothetical protein